MKFRPLLLVGATVLTSAMPALANRIPYAGPEKELFNNHIASVSEFRSFERSFFIPHTETSWTKDNDGKTGSGTDANVGKSTLLLAVTPAVTPVPEPGSISLLLVGLAATGFLAFRRRKLTSTIQVGV